MLLEQKVGQLFVVGFSGKVLSEETRKIFRKCNFANYIYATTNLGTITEVIELSNSLHSLSNEVCGMPSLITIDQEGGIVKRLLYSATQFPGNMPVTASCDSEAAYKFGVMSGIELRRLGINFNLAPCVDVNNNNDNPVIGVRSYSDKPEVVIEQANAYIKGLQEQRVIATVKHFPGHGDTNTDSHLALPCVPHDIDRLRKIELKPFAAAIEQGVDAVMTSHILFPALEPDNIPATLSHKILKGLLREQMGFKGLIVTDCLTMKAISDKYTIPNAAVMAINAGADLICIVRTHKDQEDAYKRVLQAVRSGEISEKRIDESIERINAIKEKYSITGSFLQTNMNECDYIYPEHEKYAQLISHKSITVVKNDKKGIFPVNGKRVMVISTPPIKTNVAENMGYRVVENLSFSDCFASQYESTAINLPFSLDDESITDVVAQAKEYDTIIVGTYNAQFYPQQIKLVKKLYAVNENVIVVMLRNPGDIEKLPEVHCCLAAYEYTRLSLASVTDVLLGRFEPVGEMPVKLNL